MIYFAVALGLEVLPIHKLNFAVITEWWGKLKRNTYIKSSTYSEPLLKSSQTVPVDVDEDIDVQTERKRILSGSTGNALLYLHNLRKVTICSRIVE